MATQVWGTVLGAFIHYVVMISIVNSHRDILLDNNGNYMWSGVTYQSLSNKVTYNEFASTDSRPPLGHSQKICTPLGSHMFLFRVVWPLARA